MLLCCAPPLSPAFGREFKTITKKEPHFEQEIFDKYVVPFIRDCAAVGDPQDQNYKRVSERYSPTIGNVSYYPLVFGTAVFHCIKFGVKRDLKKSLSAGCRLTIAITPIKSDMNEDIIIAIEIYTHGIKGNGEETNHKEIKNRIKKTLEEIKNNGCCSARRI